MSAVTAQHLHNVEQNYSVDQWLDQVDYSEDSSYIPSLFSLEFVNFIKLVNGTEGEENKTPVLHYKMLDAIAGPSMNIVNMLYRGSAKTTLMGEYLFLYLAVYGEIPGFGKVDIAIYVSDSIENGVKNMRKNLEYRWENSEFLRKYIPKTRFTDVRYEFENIAGKKLIVKGYGAKSISLDYNLYKDDGIVSVKDCRVGDMIFGPDGNLHPITAKSEVFNKPMRKLIFKDGRELKVSLDHINSFHTVHGREDIITSELLKRFGSERFRLKNTEAMEYSHKDFKVDPYTLGVLLGDGTMPYGEAVRVMGEVSDINHYLTKIPYDLGKVENKVTKNGTRVKRFTIVRIYKKLEELNIRGLKKQDKVCPGEYLFGSIEQRIELLRGLMDTDGSSYTYHSEFTNISQHLVNIVKSLVWSLGGSVSEYCYRNRDGNRHDLYKLNIRIQINPFSLPRKADKWNSPKDITQYTELVSIEEIEQEPSQCIAIGSDDHLYLAGEYVITHNTGVRGAKEMGKRVDLALLDDLMSDEDARSATIIASIEDTVYKAIDYALHPEKSKTIWNGTPFNQNDPLYKAIESGAWNVSVYPVCEHFDDNTTRETFKGAWSDRHTYDYVRRQYDKAKKAGKIDSFMQELMLRITSDEDRLVRDVDMKKWFDTEDVMNNEGNYNFYITTDFATSEKARADYSVISVWAYNSNEEWMLIDGECGRNLMDKNIDLMFDFIVKYNVGSVGIEVTGQQGAFVTWIKKEMHRRNTYFTIVEIRPTVDKLKRFHTVVPWFRTGKIWFNKDLLGTTLMTEAINELERATVSGFKSRHDDFLDTVSSLAEMKPWKPQHYNKLSGSSKWDDPYFEEIEDEPLGIGSYIV